MKVGALLILISLVGLLKAADQEESSCYDTNGRSLPCEPPSRSFTFGEIPQVNSTCGSPPTGFCSTIHHEIFGTLTFTRNCSNVCNESSSVNSHPPSLMTDFLLNDESWWQSENSVDTQHVVVIDIALQTLVQVEVVTINFVSFIPKSFYISRSDDYGQTYSPYHYFAVSCIDTYGVEPNQMLELANETTILCQSIDLPPLPGAKSFFPRLGRPSANDSIPGYSNMLFDFLTATNIRVVLDEHYPLPSLDVDDFGYYYAISDLNVVGSCQCNGHASVCTRSTISLKYECDCQHNTTGQFCERCTEMYQDQPWQKEIECKMCNCNNHSVECVFDPDVYQESGQKSGGVCIGCQDNTAGRQCERCASLYYQDPDRNISSPAACQPCNCTLAGVLDNGQCTQEGQCFCKTHVVGHTCNQCIPGFFNLTAENPDGCQDCNCDLFGALTNDCNGINGLCVCKPNVAGDKCDQCLPNFYQPDPTSSQGCVACNCNPGGSIDSQCDKVTGQCLCRRGIQGRTCSEVVDGYFFPFIDYLRLEAEESTTNQIIELNGENEQFTGTGYAQVSSTSDQLDLGYLTVPISGLYTAYIRYNLVGVTAWESIALSIIPTTNIGGEFFNCSQNINEISGNFSVVFLSLVMGSGVTSSSDLCLRQGQSYNFSLHTFVPGNFNITDQLYIDSLFLVPTSIPSLSVFADTQLVYEYIDCISAYSFVAARPSISPSCSSTIFTFSAAIYNGTLECECDKTGSQRGTTCEAFGGQCICLTGVRRRQCDVCIPSYYNLTTNGCSRCNCDVDGSVHPYCDLTTGICNCRDNVIERDCSTCSNRFRDLGGLQCLDCNCSIVGSINSNCNELTGVCECKPGVTGMTCDQCEDFHYNFQEAGCTSCDCNLLGSLNANCDLTTGQCNCVKNVMGRNCSFCQVGTFNLQENNPSGCQTCFCSGLTSECSSASGFVQSSVVTMFNSSLISEFDDWIISPNDTNKVMQQEDGLLICGNFSGSLFAPNKFLGNKLSSYSQYLQVRVAPEQQGIFPIVSLLLSSENIQLVANLSEIDNGVLFVQLHETAGWINLDSSTPVSEFDLQLLLSSLSSFSISLNFNRDVLLTRISLETAVQASGPNDHILWVEECECPLGYSGLSCEKCAIGYRRTLINTCELCECNGFSSDCDPESGICMNCTQATEGPSCEVCQRGFFGDPLRNISCKPCPCPLTQLEGQFSDECVLLSNDEALCTNCPSGHSGQNCEFCRSGYFGDPTGLVTGHSRMCSDCMCNGNNDQNDPFSCNATTGICVGCLGNTTGDQCERCSEGFYGDAIIAKNCTACKCDNRGSESDICNVQDGQCACLENVIGQSCDHCTAGYFGLGQPSGCVACDCDLTGSVSSQCNETGQCACLPGVAGEKCDQCFQGYFNFSVDGCQECSCSPLNSESEVCQADGECICLRGSTGLDCGECIRNYFKTSQGCTVCPNCYQEIEDETDIVEAHYSNARNRLLALQDALNKTALGPFNPRIEGKQEMVESINAIIGALSIREYNLTAIYNLVNITMEAIKLQSTEVQFSLEALQRSSTTVLVLGTTSRDLVYRTKSEFSTVNSFLDIIRNNLIPSIRVSSDRIHASVETSLNISQTFTQALQLISNQIFEIQTDLVQLSLLLTSTQEDLASINELFSNTSEILNELYRVHTTAVTDGDRIASMIYDLSSDLQLLQNQINQVQTLPNCTEEAQIRNLFSLSLATEKDINVDIIGEISHQQDMLYVLNQTLGNKITSLNLLLSQLANDKVSSTYQEARAQYFQTEVYRLAESVAQKIMMAENIFQNLQNFSDNSLQISSQADTALKHVNSISETATFVLSEAKQLQQKTFQLSIQSDTKQSVISQTTDLITSTQQDLLSLDTLSLLELQALNAEHANLTIEAFQELSIEIPHINSTIVNELNNIKAIAKSVSNIGVQGNITRRVSTTAQSAVDSLLKMSLEVSDPSVITLIEEFTASVSSELTSANVEHVVSTLRSKIAQQIEQRNKLEAIVNNLQEQVDYLEQVHSNLPLDCTK